ncbi:MAG: hypothetical protein AB1Z81_04680, partial [Desulfotignum sp.]
MIRTTINCVTTGYWVMIVCLQILFPIRSAWCIGAKLLFPSYPPFNKIGNNRGEAQPDHPLRTK